MVSNFFADLPIIPFNISNIYNKHESHNYSQNTLIVIDVTFHDNNVALNSLQSDSVKEARKHEHVFLHSVIYLYWNIKSCSQKITVFANTIYWQCFILQVINILNITLLSN